MNPAEHMIPQYPHFYTFPGYGSNAYIPTQPRSNNPRLEPLCLRRQQKQKQQRIHSESWVAKQASREQPRARNTFSTQVQAFDLNNVATPVPYVVLRGQRYFGHLTSLPSPEFHSDPSPACTTLLFFVLPNEPHPRVLQLQRLVIEYARTSSFGKQIPCSSKNKHRKRASSSAPPPQKHHNHTNNQR